MKSNFYIVNVVGKTRNQMSFVVDTLRFNIWVCKSGHVTLAKYYDCDCGGYLWLRERKITTNSGLFGEMDRDTVRDVWRAICNHFQVDFRIV